MPFGGALSLLSLAGPAISAGSALFGMANGSPAQNAQQAPPQYQYAAMPQADQNAIGLTNVLGNSNVYGALLPQYQALAQQSINNPYAQMYQGGANQTGANMYGAGGAISGSALGQLPGVSALMSLGFDPQQALYSQLQNQNQQQQAAILGQSGVAGTPYGAGVQNQANTNFNIDWQNQQLQRAIQGAQGSGNLLTSIGGNTGTGYGMQQAGAALPYNTFQGINATNLNTLGQAGQFGAGASNQLNQQIQDYLAYLSGGTGQQGVNNQTAQQSLNQANSVFSQNQTMGNQLGQSLVGLGKGWGNMNFGNFGSSPASAVSMANPFG